MFLLELMLLFVLQFQGISGEPIFLYYRPGQDAVVPCHTDGASPPTCSIVSWLYYRDPNQVATEVQKGNVRKSSARAVRLSLDAECSLIIYDITAEDVGFYTCRLGRDTSLDVFVYLSILTISPSPPAADPERDGEVTLQCSLLTYTYRLPCRENHFRWMNETGTVLLGKDLGNCVSALTVKHQSGDNRRYTCQLVENNNVLIEAEYTVRPPGPPPGSTPDKTGVIVGAVVGVLAVLVIIAAVFIIYRKRARVTEGVQKSTQQPGEPESNLTYVTVNHANHQASPYKKVKEEVTYSTVKHSGADRSRR